MKAQIQLYQGARYLGQVWSDVDLQAVPRVGETLTLPDPGGSDAIYEVDVGTVHHDIGPEGQEIYIGVLLRNIT